MVKFLCDIMLLCYVVFLKKKILCYIIIFDGRGLLFIFFFYYIRLLILKERDIIDSKCIKK